MGSPLVVRGRSDNRAGADAGVSDPIQGFCAVETESANVLVAAVDVALMAIKKVLCRNCAVVISAHLLRACVYLVIQVIYGSGLLTPATAATGAALLAGTIPSDWAERWEQGPQKPLAWLRGLVHRITALRRWSSDALRGELLTASASSPLRLSELFSPGTFLNALRQASARRLGCSMDALRLVSAWERSRLSSSDAPLSITVEGLLMQGAAFEAGQLAEAGSSASELVSGSVFFANLDDSPLHFFLF